jgi:ATP-binding cassette subfamily A (ABC1) protein 3
LGDQVAILQAPGKLLALDNPVGLKTRLGRGYTLAVDTDHDSTSTGRQGLLLDQLRKDSPDIRTKSAKGKDLYLTGSTDLAIVRKLVDRMQGERKAGNDLKYQVNGATLEEVFLDLNSEPATPKTQSIVQSQNHSQSDITPVKTEREPEVENGWEKGVDGTSDVEGQATVLPTVLAPDANPPLTPGHKRTFLLSIPTDAFTIFRKRLINLRRAWLLPLIAIIVVVCGTCIPLFFLKDRNQTCASIIRRATTIPLTWPQSPFPIRYPPLIVAPADIFGAALNNPFISGFVETQADNASFVDLFRDDYTNQDFGGVSIAAAPTSASLFAWEGSNLLNKGLSALNLVSNAILDQISPSGDAGFRITLGYRPLPSPSFLSTAQAMRWIGFL